MSQPREVFKLHHWPVWYDRANFIVNAPLPEEGYFEQLWCRQVGEDRFELCCIPFFLYDMALGDVVQTHRSGGREYVVCGVVSRSGRWVFRVHFEPEMLQFRDGVVEALAGLGTLLEWSSTTMFAVDAEDAVHAQRVADYLFEQENAGRVIYETGKS
jgi:hypothetical protein